MSSDDTTTVSVDRRPTKRRLNRIKEELEEEHPGERIRMDDVIRSLLDDREELENALARIEELERELELSVDEAEEAAA